MMRTFYSMHRAALAFCLVTLLPMGVMTVHAQAAKPKEDASHLSEGCSREEYDSNADCRRTTAQTKDADARPAGRKGATIDLTGYWVAVVTEDWRWRMTTPPKGDYASVPLNDAGKKAADAWTPSTADSCLNYGAAALMRNPVRAHLTWEDDDTLRLETDHGLKTRHFHFSASGDSGPPSLQGRSVARWDETGLSVTTTQLTPGYLRRNGVPYSGSTRLTEFFTRYSAFGDEWLTVTTVVNDPVYLSREFITSSHFKRLPDGAAWHPKPCGDT